MSKIGNFLIPSYINNIIGILWIILAIGKLYKNKFKLIGEELLIRDLFFMLILPKIIIHVYSLILFILGRTDYITRNTQTYITLIAGFAVIYLFKKDMIKYTVISFIVSFSIVIINNIALYGINTIPETFKFILTGDLMYDKSARLYEVHDYTLALGYLIIYYLFIKKDFTKKYLIGLGIISLYTLLGFKKIQILALLIVVIYVYFAKLYKNESKIYNLASYTNILIAYIFIWSLSSGLFFDLVNKLGINTMGRIYYYDAMIKLTNFSPQFLGFGRNWVYDAFANEYSYLNVGGLHSDILKNFVECGFIGFGLWLWYYSIKMLKYIEKKYGNKAAFYYSILTLYTFIIYYTDNIETYFICQFIYNIIIAKTCIYSDEKLSDC